MSNFFAQARHPITGEVETAEWLDDYNGRHRYGVRFPDGKVFPESRIAIERKRTEVQAAQSKK